MAPQVNALGVPAGKASGVSKLMGSQNFFFLLPSPNSHSLPRGELEFVTLVNEIKLVGNDKLKQGPSNVSTRIFL
jgi:hypothetical protein